ncbi:MAG: hypothetical protein ACM3OH_11465 [Bacillota bacterium]
MVRARTADSVPVPNARVVLHRVGREEQGPVDSMLTDAHGRFTFRFLADTTAIYLFSARHDGITYFASPVHTNPERPDTAIALVVNDTSSAGSVSVVSRNIVVSAPDENGARAVVEVIVLHNGAITALVARDTTDPVWGARIPHAATGMTAGEGDFSPAAVQRIGDSAAVFAPIPPGDKQVVLQYALPGDIGRVEYRFDVPAALVNLMLEEKGARVAGGLREQADSQTIQGRGFGRWEGAVPAGAVITIRLPTTHRLGRWALMALVAMMALALLAGTRRVFRAAPLAQARDAESPAALVDAIARLDAAHAAQLPDASGEAAYAAERERLKARLVAALAQRRDVP